MHKEEKMEFLETDGMHISMLARKLSSSVGRQVGTRIGDFKYQS